MLESFSSDSSTRSGDAPNFGLNLLNTCLSLFSLLRPLVMKEKEGQTPTFTRFLFIYLFLNKCKGMGTVCNKPQEDEVYCLESQLARVQAAARRQPQLLLVFTSVHAAPSQTPRYSLCARTKIVRLRSAAIVHYTSST